MRILLAVLLVLLALPLAVQAECTSCGKDRSEAAHSCKCPSFAHYDGAAKLKGVRIEATATSSAADELHLLLRDNKMHVAADIALTGPHSGEKEYDCVLGLPANELEMAILSNNSSANVKMSFLRITGVLDDGTEFVYFEQECPGVVLGNGGCPRMVLFQGSAE